MFPSQSATIKPPKDVFGKISDLTVPDNANNDVFVETLTGSIKVYTSIPGQSFKETTLRPIDEITEDFIGFYNSRGLGVTLKSEPGEEIYFDQYSLVKYTKNKDKSIKVEAIGI